MPSMVNLFAGLVLGVLHGFDRLVFRGHLPRLAYRDGMECYLATNRVLFQDFKAHAQAQTQRLLQASFAEAKRLDRPIVYLRSASASKEELARALAAKDRVQEGLIALFKCVEPCSTFYLHRNRQTHKLEIQPKIGQGSYLYRYACHPVFGFMNARVQTWYPFAVPICLNGREWLSRQRDPLGMAYQRHDNKITGVEDFARAQALLDQQLHVPWPEVLNGLWKEVPPAHPDLRGRMPMDYYWTVYQSAWASDRVVRSAADLQRLSPPWLRHAMTSSTSTDVSRFLGRKLTPDGKIGTRFEGEVKSRRTRRAEGGRVTHGVDRNSIKRYDGDRVRRIETTINDPSALRVYRPKQGGPADEKDWRPMRQGIADLHRRAQVSQAANDRYAAATAAVQDTTSVRDLVEPLCRRAPAPGPNRQRKVRALHPLAADDAALLTAVLDPKFAVHGLRNRDLVGMLYPTAPADERERRRRSSRVTRLLRLLRGHGVLHKVPTTHRYVVSESGRRAGTALWAARNANADFLTTNAA